MRLVIFDLDGTLVDSQNEIVEAQHRAFATLGLAPPSRARSLSVVGLSLKEAFAALVGEDGPIDSLAEAYKAAWTDIRQQPDYRDPLYPGAAEIIADLAETPDTRLGIATGKSRRGVDRILAARDWARHFATIQTADTHPSKPDPSMVASAIAEAGVGAASTVLVGDTTFDMAMANAAGVRAIGVGWGYHDPADVQRAGADVVVTDFAALRVALDSWTHEVT